MIILCSVFLALGIVLLFASILNLRKVHKFFDSDLSIDISKKKAISSVNRFLIGGQIIIALAYGVTLLFLVQGSNLEFPDPAERDFIDYYSTITSASLFLAGLFLYFASQSKIRLIRSIVFTQDRDIKSKTVMLHSLSRFVPPQFIHQLEKAEITEISAGDAITKQFTIIHCEIRGGSAMLQQISEENIFNFLNHCFSNIIPIIESHGGFVEQFIGNGLRAIFEGSSDDALSAALQIQDLAETLKINIPGKQEEVQVGIGINAGKISLGALGTQERISPTVIGDAVGLAWQIQELTKKLSLPVITSLSVVESLHNPNMFQLKELQSVTLHGQTTPTSIYQLLSPKT